MKPALLPALLLAATLAGCASEAPAPEPQPTFESIAADQLLASSRRAVDALFAPISREWLGDAPILVATLANVNDLRTSSAFGRTVSEQYSSAIVGRGYNVKELKLRENVFVQEGTGEMMLSREVKAIAQAQAATVVMVGTYSTAADLTYVNIKLVRTEDSRILAAHDYQVPNNRNITRLLMRAN